MIGPALRRGTRVLGLSLSMSFPCVANAAPVCDAGVLCPDTDNDGFAACGCEWSGTPCDCDDADPAVFPGAPEPCDSTKDSNCSGIAPDRCPSGKGCLGSVCVPQCIPLDDFGCANGSIFSRQPDSGICLCAPKDCTLFGCPAGQTCDDTKTCIVTCDPGVRCPHGQICRGFGCVDPCAEVTCPEGAVCRGGRCLPSCTCDPGRSCAAGETCDDALPVPTCVESSCIGIACPSGQHCERGTCVDGCEGVVCPMKRVCRKVSVNGAPSEPRCVDLCSPSPCKPGYTCEWRTGACIEIPLADGGLVEPPEVEASPLDVAGGGWLCTTTRLGEVSAATAFGALGAALSFLLRRRRSRASRPDR